MEEIPGAVLSLTMLVLMFVFVWRQWLARSDAARRRPLRARVVAVSREESGSRMYRWFVTTYYDVPGHGELTHRRGFEDEGPAILWQRRHREGSEHDVIPNRLEAGSVFVPEDLVE